MIKNKLLSLGVVLGVSVLFAVPTFAAPSFTPVADASAEIDLVANSTVEHTIAVANYDNDLVDEDLSAVNSDVKFGTIVINSNSSEGFDLSIASIANSGELVLLDSNGVYVSNPVPSQKIAYEVSLNQLSGTLGNGLNKPASIGIDASTPGADKDMTAGTHTYNFTGVGDSSTVDYTLELRFSSAEHTDLIGGQFKDRIQVTIQDV